MKIVVLGTRGFPNVQGGVEKHCEELYPRLVKLGCTITVLGRGPYTGTATYDYNGVKVIPVDCPKNKFFEAFIHTFRGVFKAKALGCDILHIHAIGPALFIPLARLLGMKVVMTHHGHDYERKKWNTFAKLILRIGEFLGVTSANRTITVSNPISESVTKKYHKDTVTIPNGFSVTTAYKSQRSLEKFGLKPRQFVLAAGRFVPEKGFCELVDAFKGLPVAGRAGWKLVIAGAADHEDEFSRSLKAQCATDPDIILTGFVTKDILSELYRNAGVFILPSFHEGLPIVLLEALSCGCSCLASDIPANIEIGLGRERYFSPGNIEMIRSKLLQFMNRPDTEQERSRRAHEMSKFFDWDVIAVQTLSVYTQAITGVH